MTRQRVIYSVPAGNNPWASYNRRLRRFNLIVVAMCVLVVALLVFMVMSAAKPGPWADFALPLLAVPWFACGFAYMITYYQLMSFRCPQCGGRFMLTWWSSWPWRRHCPHCGFWRDTLTPPST